MQLTLVLPNLLDMSPDALAAAHAPALARLLSSNGAPSSESDGTLAIACTGVGVAKQHDWPVAPWLARAAGFDPGHRFWLCAEPLNLQLGRDNDVFAAAVGDLSESESRALISSLSAHFSSDGMEFVERNPGRWSVALATPQQLETFPPGAMLAKAITEYLPRGADAARWHRWQSEMQMLLFDHPVNRARESEGRAVANYVWMWGGGTLQAAGPSEARELFAEPSLFRDLAHAVGVDVAPVPASLAELRESQQRTSALVWFGALDTDSVRDRLVSFDARWAVPLERALDTGTIDATLVAGGAAGALSFAPRTSGMMRRLRRRWTQTASLSTLLGAHVDG